MQFCRSKLIYLYDILNEFFSAGRARHRRNQMLPVMIFGMTAIGMVMVPIGFQLLAVLGGKALLLSKMALLLASINGLRRVKLRKFY